MSRRWMDRLGNLPVIGPVFAFVTGVFGLLVAVLKRERISDE